MRTSTPCSERGPEGYPFEAWRRTLGFAAILGLLVLATSPASAPAAMAAAVDPSPDCDAGPEATAQADRIMAGDLALSHHAPVRLPQDPTWREDIGRDRNWGFQYHSLRWILPLLDAWQVTGDTAYRSRAASLLRGWHRSNPRRTGPPSMAWNDHATALRSVVYACAAGVLGRRPWLSAAIARHGATLADPSFYVKWGNHALNQDIGLLEAGLASDRADWIDLAVRRVTKVIATDVDARGVNAEGSVGYQLYIYERAERARERILAAGRTVPPTFDRVGLMPRFLAHATLPDGTYETLGDTEVEAATAIAGTEAEFAATAGSSGPQPASADARYRRGYAFGRSGWGETRPFVDEIAYSVRFGPPPKTGHQHLDGGALTVYGYGARLLIDPGGYTYQSDAWRDWFRSRSAHNVATVAETVPRRGSGSTLATSSTPSMRLYRVGTDTYPGTRLDRAIVWSPGGEYFLVEDRATSTQSRTVTQRWHLAPDSSPTRSGTSVWTRQARGNVLIRQLAGGRMRIVQGKSSPIQGWVSPEYGTKVAAPVLETRGTGRSVRLLSLIVPSADPHADVTVSGLRLFADGYRVRVTVNGTTELVVVREKRASITVLATDGA